MHKVRDSLRAVALIVVPAGLHLGQTDKVDCCMLATTCLVGIFNPRLQIRYKPRIFLGNEVVRQTNVMAHPDVSLVSTDDLAQFYHCTTARVVRYQVVRLHSYQRHLVAYMHQTLNDLSSLSRLLKQKSYWGLETYEEILLESFSNPSQFLISFQSVIGRNTRG